MSRYASAHANPQGAGDARPTAMQIVTDNGMEGKLVGKAAVVTGISSGIGIETTRALAATGLTLFLTARNLDKARTALGDIYKPERMHLIHMDQSSLDSVRDAAKQILAQTDKLSLLVANAAIMAIQTRELTQDGFELQFATNHLAHFLLFELLRPALLAGSAPEFNSRVVVVSASAHRVHGISESGNYNCEKGGYEPWLAYAQSKTANVYMASEIDRRFGDKGVHALSLHPGNFHSGLVRYLPEEEIRTMVGKLVDPKMLKTQAQAAATTLVAAIGPEWEGKGGRYLSECAEAPEGEDDGDVASSATGSHTYDQGKAARLWADSLRMVGLPAATDEE